MNGELRQTTSRLAIVAAAGLFAGGIALAPAQAADLGGGTYKPALMPAPTASWTGWYGGGHVGYGWSELHLSSEKECNSTKSGFDANDACSGTDADGWFGGAQFGVQFQGAGSNWVGGLEVDVSGADINDRFLASATGSKTRQAFSQDIDLMGTVRGRLGYVLNSRPVLVYATGGLSFAHMDIDTINCSKSCGLGAANSHLGWNIGAGAEWKARNNQSIAVQYLYSDFMDEMAFFKKDSKNEGKYDFDIHQVTLRYNFHIQP